MKRFGQWALLLAAISAGSGCESLCGCCRKDKEQPPPAAQFPPPGAMVPSVAPQSPGSGAYGGVMP